MVLTLLDAADEKVVAASKTFFVAAYERRDGTTVRVTSDGNGLHATYTVTVDGEPVGTFTSSAAAKYAAMEA